MVAVETAFLKELYFRELDRRDVLDSAPTLRIGVLALLGALHSFYFSVFPLGDSGWTWLFLAVTASATVCSVLAILWIVRCFVGYTWQYLPPAGRLLEFFDELIAYEKEYNLGHRRADALFNEALRTQLATTTEHNEHNNVKRSELLYGASRFLAAAVILTLLAAVPVLVEALRAGVSSSG